MQMVVEDTTSVTLYHKDVGTPVATSTNATCFNTPDGTATVDMIGGTAPFTYSWLPTGGTDSVATGLLPGTYTVFVTDANNCLVATSVVVGPSTPLAINVLSTTNVSCYGYNDGSAWVQPVGGSPGYSLLWSNGDPGAIVSNVGAGVYTVTATDFNGCTATATVIVSEFGPINTIMSKSDVTCNLSNDGSATVVAAGLNPPFTYFWSPFGGTGNSAATLLAGTYTVIVTDNIGCTTQNSIQILEPPALSLTFTNITPATCYNTNTGAATVLVSGGTPGYTYSWAPSGGTASTATGLGTGVYTVTASDANGCTITSTVLIEEPTQVFATIDGKTNASCTGTADGTAHVVSVGGIPPYTYNWSPFGGTGDTAVNLAAGTYFVIATDSLGCQATDTVIINEPNPIVITTSGTIVSCNGGSDGTTVASVTGGTPSYSFLWNPSAQTTINATGLTAGVYSVTVTDVNGCTNTATYIVQEPSPLLFTNSNTNVSCFGFNDGTATVNPFGATPPYAYNWAPFGGSDSIATGLLAGTYIFTISDSKGCINIDSVVITEPTELVATTSQVDVTCNGDSTGSAIATATGGVPGYSYLWSPIGGTSALASGLPSGNYNVQITDAAGCSTTGTISIIIAQPAPLVAIVTTTSNVTCAGQVDGTATAIASGGIGPYAYNWIPTGGTDSIGVNLSAGSYTVVVTDAFGCTTSATCDISEPFPFLSVSSTTSTPSCVGGNDGNATAIPTGGTPGYSFNWSSGGSAVTEFGLISGIYTVTVTDANGCTKTGSAIITDPGTINFVNIRNRCYLF